jgi:hypothetical protein
MNRLLALPAIAAFGLSSCGTMNQPISSSEFDPLAAPGSSLAVAQENRVSFRPGQYVQTSMASTGFYRTRPKGNADADRLLSRNTRLKVVSSDSSYVRVELDSGELGFVPAVMLQDPSSRADDELLPSGNEFQVYPPLDLPGSNPLPFTGPDGLPTDNSVPSLMNLEIPEPPELGATPVADDELPPSSPGSDDDELPPSSPGSDDAETESEAGTESEEGSLTIPQ